MANSKAILADIISHIKLEPTILFLGDKFRTDGAEHFIAQRWACAYTTIQDSDLTRLFQAKVKRRVSDVIASQDAKLIQYNHRELSLVRINGLDDTSKDDLEQEEIAQALLETLPDLLETYGRIIINGLDPITDKMFIQQLYMQLAKIKRKKFIYFFGIFEPVGNPYIARLEQNGAAVLVPESVEDILQELEYDEDFSEIIDFEEETGRFAFYSKGATVHMDTELDNQLLLNTEPFAQLLGIQTVEQTDLFPPEQTAQYFQAFLQTSTIGMPKWYGYRENNSFHLKRYFEDALYDKAVLALKSAGDKKRSEKPIMLCGQACSGKSNALGALAYRIFKDGNYSVIYISNSDVLFTEESEKTSEGITVKKRSETFEQLDALLKQMDTKVFNPNPTLIIWDTSCRVRSELNKARDLLNLLRSRGRRVQIVCTAYQRSADNDKREQYTCIDIDILLRENENEKVHNLLVEKAGFRQKDAKNMMKYYSAATSFIGSLYLFQDLHKSLHARLRRENEGHIEDVSNQLANISKDLAEEQLNTVMRQKLVSIMDRLGKTLMLSLPESANDINLDATKDIERTFKRLMCCIAVCTNYKEDMPLPMAIRFLGEFGMETSKVMNIILGNALIREFDSVDGSVLRIRSELEAKMLLNEYDEWNTIDLIISIIKHLSPGSIREQRLIQNLIRLIGPNNRESERSVWKQDKYFSQFMVLVKELRIYREKEDKNTPLLLTEIMLTREICSDRRWEKSEDDRITLLSQIHETAKTEIKRHQSEKMNRFLSNLHVEWAHLSIRLYRSDETLSKEELFKSVKEKMEKVIHYYPEDNYAYAAYLWAGVHYVKSLSDADEKMELLEGFYHYIDLMSYGDKRDENILGELDALADSLNMNEDRFKQSVQEGRSHGIYFRARGLIGSGENSLNFKESLDKNSKSKCKEIIDLMEHADYYPIVLEKAACLHILINAKWLYANSSPIIPLDEENVRTHMNNTMWEQMYDLCMRYLELSVIRPPHIVYLLALCCAQLEDHRGQECDALFEELRRGTSYEKRRLHILCGKEGHPIPFTGRIDGRYDRRHNRGWVNLKHAGFIEPVYFRAELIGRREGDLTERELLTGLNIATSFSGLQACLL
ncbi:hypothetical protein [Cohnella abietis]|uniref:Uncharacterized protein n=1 Tax=Cohnella abietis TaxID=2507935 RepID=A0A3T1D7A1_9BACL|nr:hypothetical protein [Cohnella abietis]BBI33966.1 hypothetical protein KCTCHS21_33650 [Cohnella abietis]